MIRDRLPEDIRRGRPGWRWRWWMAESEWPTVEEIDEITDLNWNHSLSQTIQVAGIVPQDQYRYLFKTQDEVKEFVNRKIEYGCEAKKLGYSVDPIVRADVSFTDPAIGQTLQLQEFYSRRNKLRRQIETGRREKAFDRLRITDPERYARERPTVD